MRVQDIDGSTTITEPGTYTLTTDIEQGEGTRLSETCIRIEADDVVLDGAGHTVDGWGTSDTTGIGVYGWATRRNVTIKNLTVTDWNRGVFFANVQNGRVRNVEAANNSYGISFENVRDSALEGTTTRNNLIGIALDQRSTGNDLSGGTMTSNHVHDRFHRTDC